eukprot:273804-Amphidinium_carterae.4
MTHLCVQLSRSRVWAAISITWEYAADWKRQLRTKENGDSEIAASQATAHFMMLTEQLHGEVEPTCIASVAPVLKDSPLTYKEQLTIVNCSYSKHMAKLTLFRALSKKLDPSVSSSL